MALSNLRISGRLGLSRPLGVSGFLLLLPLGCGLCLAGEHFPELQRVVLDHPLVDAVATNLADSGEVLAVTVRLGEALLPSCCLGLWGGLHRRSTFLFVQE